MDPRAKLRGFNNVLMLLAKLTDTDYSAYFTEVRAELATMFNKYDSKFSAVWLQKPAQPSSSGNKKTTWGKIFASDGSGFFQWYWYWYLLHPSLPI